MSKSSKNITKFNLLAIFQVILVFNLNAQPYDDIYTNANNTYQEYTSESEYTDFNDTIDILRKECREIGPYSAYRTCTDFAFDLHHLCKELGINCKTISYTCPKIGHLFNLVEDPKTGFWHLVDTTKNTINYRLVWTDVNLISLTEICAYYGIDEKTCNNCKYKILDEPLRPFYAHSCKDKNSNLMACNKCCDKRASNPAISSKPDVEKWRKDCKRSCNNEFYLN